MQETPRDRRSIFASRASARTHRGVASGIYNDAPTRPDVTLGTPSSESCVPLTTREGSNLVPRRYLLALYSRSNRGKMLHCIPQYFCHFPLLSFHPGASLLPSFLFSGTILCMKRVPGHRGDNLSTARSEGYESMLEFSNCVMNTCISHA